MASRQLRSYKDNISLLEVDMREEVKNAYEAKIRELTYQLQRARTNF